jgi:hypothetical protein
MANDLELSKQEFVTKYVAPVVRDISIRLRNAYEIPDSIPALAVESAFAWGLSADEIPDIIEYLRQRPKAPPIM